MSTIITVVNPVGPDKMVNRPKLTCQYTPNHSKLSSLSQSHAYVVVISRVISLWHCVGVNRRHQHHLNCYLLSIVRSLFTIDRFANRTTVFI